MDCSSNYSLWLRCHTCGQRQPDRRAYRDHLLWSHHEVARRGADVPVRLEGRELEAVWAGIRRRQLTGMALAARRREQLGLPRVSEREAACRLHDNRARSARRLSAAARARAASNGRPRHTRRPPRSSTYGHTANEDPPRLLPGAAPGHAGRDSAPRVG